MDRREPEGIERFSSSTEDAEASYEDAVSDQSWRPDSADSADEANFIEGLDPSQDIVSDVEEGTDSSSSSQSPCALKRGRGTRGTGRPAKRGRRHHSTGKRSKSETLPGNAARWRTEKEPDTLPQLPPRFIPKRRPGVQPPLAQHVENASPGELFRLYFDQAAVETLCAHTNKNAEKNIAAGEKFVWMDVTEAEMYSYIGMTLYMGILKLPNRRDFWRTNSIFQLSYPSKVMSRGRFFTITQNLHMSDPEKDALNDSKKGSGDYDCLHRVRPLYDSLRVACKDVYHPRQKLSVDERMVAIKARIALKKNIKNKPTRWGIKLFVLSDNTGYTVDFSIYTGKSTLTSGKGLSFDAVTSLIDQNHLGSGYHIYCDHFYTSPALFLHLHDQGFRACGAYKDTRIGVPKTKRNALTRKSPRGSIRWIREGALVFIKWMDSKEVSVCSTLHTARSGDTVKRACKVGGKRQAVEVPVPSAIKDYNHYMGGVNLSEQPIGSYSSRRRSRKWYVTVLHHFIDIAVADSFIVHKELCSRLEQQPLTHQAFQEQLIADLCAVTPPTAVQESHQQHIPVAISEGASGSKKATQGRRKCKLCGRCTPFMCEACRVPLCVILDRNCHKLYHM